MDTEWHFPVMIGASLLLYVGVLRVVLGAAVFRRRRATVAGVALVVVVGGMLFGKYGATFSGCRGGSTTRFRRC